MGQTELSRFLISFLNERDPDAVHNVIRNLPRNMLGYELSNLSSHTTPKILWSITSILSNSNLELDKLLIFK